MLTNHLRTMTSRWFPVLMLPVLLLIATRVRADESACHYSIVDATITDLKTKLTWQRDLDAAMYTSDEAAPYCMNLGLAGGGWRLPTIKELQTLVDESTVAPAIDTSVFPNTPSSRFWSSTLYAGGAGLVWIVNFSNGSADTAAVSDMNHVRCVR